MTTLFSLVILPVLEEAPPHPVGSLAIGSLEALSLHCLQPFSTQDTRGQPFHAQAQEALDVLLRHPSGGVGQESGVLTCCNQGPSMPGDLNPCPSLCTGWWLVGNEDQQTAWFPAPYLEEVALGQGQPLGSSGNETNPLPRPLPCWAVCSKAGDRKHLTQG